MRRGKEPDNSSVGKIAKVRLPLWPGCLYPTVESILPDPDSLVLESDIFEIAREAGVRLDDNPTPEEVRRRLKALSVD